jgi:hypothetical protein
MDRCLASLLVAAIALTGGCSRHATVGAEPYPDALQVSQIKAPPSAKNTLSREHSVSIDIVEAELASRFNQVVSRCEADTVTHCTILRSDLSTGQNPQARIKLRIDPGAVDGLVAFAASLGKLRQRSTEVQDLAEAMEDTQSRLAMLTAYRKQLLELQAKSATNIDAAVKIASELSTVQGNIERASGEAAYQIKRTTSDVVLMNLDVTDRHSFWRPVHDAAGDFFGNLSNGISQAITAIAYIVPWLFVVIPGLYLLRFLWRRRGR